MEATDMEGTATEETAALAVVNAEILAQAEVAWAMDTQVLQLLHETRA